jgi:hypothetical protein
MAKETISKEDLKKAVSMKVDGSIFDQTEGEVYAGLNILKLEKGEAAGPFALREIKSAQLLGKPPKKGAKDTRKPVDVYVADFSGREVRMPIAAAFTMKAKDAKLSPGDTFLVRRSSELQGLRNQGHKADRQAVKHLANGLQMLTVDCAA